MYYQPLFILHLIVMKLLSCFMLIIFQNHILSSETFSYFSKYTYPIFVFSGIRYLHIPKKVQKDFESVAICIISLAGHCLGYFFFRLGLNFLKKKSIPLAWKITIQSGHNFAHNTTAKLLWRAELGPDCIINVRKFYNETTFTRFQFWARKVGERNPKWWHLGT